MNIQFEPSVLDIIFTPVRITCAFLSRMLQRIIDDTQTVPAAGECHLAALTAADRVSWAKARTAFFATGINKTSLDAIEKVMHTLLILEYYFILLFHYLRFISGELFSA